MDSVRRACVRSLLSQSLRINEWKPQDFTHFGPYELIMLGALGIALHLGAPLPPLRIFMVFGLLHLSHARGELYGEDFMLHYGRSLSLYDLPDLPRLLDEYKIKTTVLSPRRPAVALLDRFPDWKRVFSDDVAIVHQWVKPLN